MTHTALEINTECGFSLQNPHSVTHGESLSVSVVPSFQSKSDGPLYLSLTANPFGPWRCDG